MRWLSRLLPSRPPEPAKDSALQADSEIDGIKAAEKLLDYLKADVERVAAEIRTAEDRARGNATLAGVALPLVTFLRTLPEGNGTLETVVAVIAALAIIVAVFLTIGVVRNQKTNRTKLTWYKERQEDTYLEKPNARYDRFLHELQTIWIGYLADGRRIRDVKYKALGWQTAAVGVALTAVAVLVIASVL
ncbi:hypothetical protein [Deinococcus oregonensis]